MPKIDFLAFLGFRKRRSDAQKVGHIQNIITAFPRVRNRSQSIIKKFKVSHTGQNKPRRGRK